MAIKKGEILEGTVEKVSFPNKGIVPVEGKTVVVKNTIPGQQIRFRINKKKNNEVLVRLAYNAEMAKAAAKKAVREELEKKGNNLHEQLDKVLGF